MDTKKIGKIQISIGCILLLITIIGSILIIKNIYLGSLAITIGSTTGAWGSVARETNATAIGNLGHVMSDVNTLSLIVKTAMYNFGICSFILVVLSIMFILQGLANLNRK